MPRAKRVTPETVEITREDVEQVIAHDENLAVLAGALESLGADGESYEVWLYKLPKGARREWQFLARMPIDEFNLGDAMEAMRDEYGGGDFRVQIRKEGGGIIKNVLLAVAPVKPKNDKAVDDSAARIAELQIQMAQKASGDMMGMFTLMMQSQQQASDRMMQMMMAQSQQSTAMLTAMMGSNRPADPASMISAMAQTMQMLKPEPAPPAQSLKDQLEVFSMIKEIAGEGGGGADDSVLGNITKMASAFGPAIAAAVSSDKQKPPMPQPRPGMRPNPAARPPNLQAVQAAPQTAPEPLPDNDAAPELDALSQVILKAAQTDKAVDPYAEMILDALPEEHHPALLETLKLADGMDQIAMIMPVIKQLPAEWAEALREALIEMLSDDEGDDGDDGEPLPSETAPPPDPDAVAQ